MESKERSIVKIAWIYKLAGDFDCLVGEKKTDQRNSSLFSC